MIRVFSQYVSSKGIFLMFLESILAVVCLVFAAAVRFRSSPVDFEVYTMFPDFGVQLLVSVVVFQACFHYNELYDLSARRSRADQILRLWQALGAACLLLGILYYLVPSILIGRGVFLIGLGFFALSSSLSRMALDAAWRLTAPPQNIVILGTGELAATIRREIALRADLNVRLMGFVDKTKPPEEASFLGYPILGGLEELERIAEERPISKIIVALDDHRGAELGSLVTLRVRGTPVEDAQNILASLTGRVWLRTVRPSWFVYSDGFRRSRMTLLLKRAIDVGFGLVGLVLSAPVMAVVAAAIRLDSRGAAVYRQERVGLGGRPFQVLKFRSMRVDAEAASGAQWSQENDPRVTRVGKILRKYRLDELPQFLNVLRGEMSFVGPRPERPVFVEQLKEKIPYYEERHSVRPGVTGWAQVQYPYGASIEDAYRKLEYDLFYLKNMSIAFDVVIVLQTIRIVLFGKGR